MDAFHLTASLALPDSTGELPTRIVYLPEGTHEVQGSVNGKAAKRTITVGPDSLEALQAGLASRLAKKVRPHGGFDHKEGKASFIPKAFEYEAGRGVVLDLEWTKSGAEAIAGKDYSYFSPSFMASKGTGLPIGLPTHGEIGSLVNEPAFEAIEKIAASHQSEDQPDMTADLIKLGLLTDEQAKDAEKIGDHVKANLDSLTNTAVTSAVAEATKDAPEKSELEKEIERLKGENLTLTESLSAKRTAEAEDAIAEAVKAGRIPAQDEETKGFWREQLTKEDNAAAKKQLAKLPGAEALKAGRVIDNTKREDGPKGLARTIAAFSNASN